jgi:endoglycosylceramidase
VRRALAVGIVVLTLAACGDDGADRGDAEVGSTGADQLPRLHAVRGERPGIFDEEGRQVVLRGVNLNGLAHYARNNSELDPTLPITDETWDQIADEGFNVVRLLVSWSRLEPERGEVDAAYVDEIRAAVRAAAERGLYTVVDMHQDAWGPFVATPDGADCAEGREPANGWDGAPEWATPSPEEFDSCRGEGGEAKPGSELVTEAWHRFYTEPDGVQSNLVDLWEHLATELASEPSIAGYDLLNEPGHGRDESSPDGLATEFPLLGEFYARAVEAIRRGEDTAGIDPRPIFFEHTVAGNPPLAGFSDDPGLVFAPHVYGGSIVEFLTVDQNWDVVAAMSEQWDTSIWVGEYGWWTDPTEEPDVLGRLERFASREDGGPSTPNGTDTASFVPVGSAWWQWNSGCGDPHQITEEGQPPDDEIWQYRVTNCADGTGQDEDVVPGWREILTRPAIRFAPGWITRVTGAPGPDVAAARTLVVEAEDATPGTQAELWVPGDESPAVGGNGIAHLELARHGLGWVVTVEVCAPTYQITVGASAGQLPDSCPG